MDRDGIVELARGLIDEYTELPQGMIQDEQSGEIDLVTLANLSQQNVALDLAIYIPWRFTKTKVFGITAATREYDWITDLSVTDCALICDIYHNKSNERAKGLLFLTQDQISDHFYVGETGADPKAWGYESKSSIFIEPTPSGTVANRLKMFYFYELANMSTGSSEPDLPKVAHKLVAIDVVDQLHEIAQKDPKGIRAFYQNEFKRTLKILSIKPVISTPFRSGLKEHLRTDIWKDQA